MTDSKSSNKEKFIIKVLIISLAACLIFMGFQSLYIFALSTGRTGLMTYESMPEETKKEQTGGSTISELDYEFYNDPNFSLEEAASVYDPNKETLTTMEIVDYVSPATVSVFIVETTLGQQSAISSGSGFMISEDGYVVTNAHVIDSVLQSTNQHIFVSVPGYEDMIEARIVGTDEATDVGVIKLIEGEDYPIVTLGDSDLLRVGELVVAIGNSLGTLDGTVTVGVVSALDREMNNNGYAMRLIQTDASINTGNSGGPLINSYGEVIGITNAKMSSAEGLGFAIPISSVKTVIESIIQYGYVIGRPYLGISVTTIGSTEYFGATDGVFVGVVDDNGPADEAGFIVGDRILEVDGVEIERSSDIIDVRDSHQVGDEIIFVIERDGQQIELTLRIGDSSQINES